jgi:hypothetical protein
MAVVVIESHGSGFYHECHKAGCKDVAKKVGKADRQYVCESIAEAKAVYESDNDNFEAESGEGAGYYWDQHVKVFDCAKAAEDKKFVDDHFKIIVVN